MVSNVVSLHGDTVIDLNHQEIEQIDGGMVSNAALGVAAGVCAVWTAAFTVGYTIGHDLGKAIFD